MARDIIALDALTANNLGTFRKINEVTLPTRWPESWYQDSLSSDQIVQLAYYTELPVGAIKAKAINTNHKGSSHSLSQQAQLNSKIVPNAVYLESLAVLKAYQHLGIGSKLLDYLIKATKDKFIHEIVLHVHVDNNEAIDWYSKKGFTRGEVVKDYYKEQGLENPDAIIFTLTV